MSLNSPDPVPLDTVRRLRRDNADLRDANSELERVKAELERSNADLERFAYVASHDLSEPLRAISAFSQRLSERYADQLDDDAQEYFGFILDGTERLRMLIQALLAYSRLGRAELRVESIDTERMVGHVLETLTTTRVCHVETHDLPVVAADRAQLAQVFQNLIGNAMKFVDVEEPRIDVSAERGDGEWTFRVADNGIGIDPRYAARIFEPFERLHGRNHYPGAGIGLAICQRAIERHGGAITVRPRPGGGTVFTFTLPDQP